MFVHRVAGDDWRATGARRSVPGCMDEFAIHRAAIDGFLRRAQSLRLEERVGLRVGAIPRLTGGLVRAGVKEIEKMSHG